MDNTKQNSKAIKFLTCGDDFRDNAKHAKPRRVIGLGLTVSLIMQSGFKVINHFENGKYIHHIHAPFILN